MNTIICRYVLNARVKRNEMMARTFFYVCVLIEGILDDRHVEKEKDTQRERETQPHAIERLEKNICKGIYLELP